VKWLPCVLRTLPPIQFSQAGDMVGWPSISMVCWIISSCSI
jgi:hypothetical protein